VKKSKTRSITSKEAEIRKRQLKRSEGLIEKGVDVSIALLDEIPTEVAAKLIKMLGFRINHRDLMSAAISSHLPEILRTLLRLGIRSAPKGNQRPRKFDALAWESLEAAEEVCGLPKVVLLRACLSLLAKRGVTRVDLQASLDEIIGMGDQRDQA
jgi:hypothetical protein